MQSNGSLVAQSKRGSERLFERGILGQARPNDKLWATHMGELKGTGVACSAHAHTGWLCRMICKRVLSSGDQQGKNFSTPQSGAIAAEEAHARAGPFPAGKVG